jgi:hypothetical protein
MITFYFCQQNTWHLENRVFILKTAGLQRCLFLYLHDRIFFYFEDGHKRFLQSFCTLSETTQRIIPDNEKKQLLVT